MSLQDRDRELSYILLVELLAHQFCYPVRWIETQDVLLADCKAERVIEIGSNETLIQMAKLTLDRKYQSFDAANGLRRELHSFKKNKRELYIEDLPALEDTKQELVPKPVAIVQSTMETVTLIHAPQPGTAMDDSAITAAEIVKVIVAYTLRKDLTEASNTSTIKELSEGRSTLQNEIVGDLMSEFGRLPGHPEDMSLEELSAAIQESFGGKLGTQSSRMIAKMASAKLPGSYTVASLRNHLFEKWGFGPGRQDSVLILSTLQQPPGRLGSDEDVQAHFEQIARQYAKNVGLNLDYSANAISNIANATPVVSKDVLDHLQTHQRSLNQAMLEVYARSLGRDLHKGELLSRQLQADATVLLEQLDLWSSEHGDIYAAGIKPIFSSLKARRYDSSWNWVLQDLYTIIYDVSSGRIAAEDITVENQLILITNRSSRKLLSALRYLKSKFSQTKGEIDLPVISLLERLIETSLRALAAAPLSMTVPTNVGPLTVIDDFGKIKYTEAPRLIQISQDLGVDSKGIGDIKDGELFKHKPPQILCTNEKNPNVSISNTSSTRASSPDSYFSNESSWNIVSSSGLDAPPPEYASHALPLSDESRHVRKKTATGWEFDQLYTSLYLNTLESATTWGMSFDDKHVLVTGAGAGSIGGEIVQRLISGGAKVVVTTSNYNPRTTRHFQDLYTRYGARNSELVLVPFNQGSKRDVKNLAHYIYHGLGWDLDHVVPFAAISENGSEIDNIGSKSELAHRIMLTNLIRLLGEIKKQKEALGSRTRPAQVILPLSPNHGIFGNDGLYSESKLALEGLLNKWHSESWDEYLSVCGVIIGWTRGTTLMKDNDSVSYGIEKLGLQTFSQHEMACSILGLMMPLVLSLIEQEPIIADLSGGMNSVPTFKALLTAVRDNITETSTIRQAIFRENSLVDSLRKGKLRRPVVNLAKRANIQFDFPRLPCYETDIEPISTFRKGMLDLDKVVVIAGFAEVGPLGNARTRWQMEAYGQLSLEGCVELAWVMGIVKYQNQNKVQHGEPYSGLIDTKTGEHISDSEVKSKYEKYILEHTGIRLIENQPPDAAQDHSKQFLQEISIQQDLEPFEATLETALDFEREHGDKALVIKDPESDTYSVQLKKGACLFVSKSSSSGRTIGAQVPTGWDPKTYGISDDIINQVDRVTLYTLVCTVEALLSAGITDPYEFYQFIHVSEVGNIIGAGMGGLTSMDKMFRERVLERPVQKDILQETFINTTAAWVNMLLMASAGPTVTPVAACATAIESLHVGYDTILNGRAKVCLVGGCDDMSHVSRHEFRNMKATIDAEEDFSRGRDPKEMSRPATTSRKGFVESEGAGVQVITTASLALEMGLPIHGVIAFTHTANDKNGRSVPQPGSGLLTSVIESPGKYPSPLLSMPYRKRNLTLRFEEIEEKMKLELSYLKEQSISETDSAWMEEESRNIVSAAARQRKEALSTFGNAFWKGDSRISPLRGALATWGLTIDDLTVASFHGTSTQANEANESRIINEQMSHLGRKEGNPVLAVFQKSLTGHPKGAAAAWMLNGCLQIMDTGLVPGNRNADNIDTDFEQYDHITYPSRSIQTGGVDAFSITSFGFGQKGGQAVGIHPKYLFATLEAEEYAAYEKKRKVRHAKAYKHFHEGLATNKVFVAKNVGPYPEADATAFLTNPHSRVSLQG